MSCSLIPLLIGFGSAVLGGLIGWYWYRNRRYNPLKNLYDEKETALTQLNHAYSAINTRFSSLQNDHVNLQKTNEELMSKHDSLSKDFENLSAARSTLSNEYSALKTAYNQKNAEVEAEIKKLNVEHEMKLAQAENDYALLSIDYSNAVRLNKTLTATVTNLSSEKETLISEYGNYRTEANIKYFEAQNAIKNLETEKAEIAKVGDEKIQYYISLVNEWENKHKAN